MSRRLVALLFLVACQKASPPPPAGTVTGHVAIDPGAKAELTKGPLLVTWLAEDEMTAFAQGKPTPMILRHVFERGVVTQVDEIKDATFTLPAGPGRIALVAAFDPSHAGLPAVEGAGKGTLIGMTPVFEGATAPTLTLASHPPNERPEVCKGDRLTLEHIDAPEVAGKVGNDTSRRACVRVPKGYAENPDRHYPVIYALPGLMSTDGAVIASYPLDIDDVILVAVDTSSKTGSTYFADSPTSGNFDAFFAKDLIPTIDAHYRTLPKREARATVGHSTGGFNSVSVALRHPDLIGVIGASSPDGLDLRVWLGTGELKPWMAGFARVEKALGGAGQFVSYAADWSPSSAPAGYDWFVDDSGHLVESVVARWLEQSPTTWVRDPKRVEALKPFSGHIMLAVGDSDEFDLHPPTVAFSKTLTEAGIANELLVTQGGHGNQKQHLVAIAKFCAEKLEKAH